MADVDLTPTAEMARNAARGLELRREHGRGGTEVGVARARDISNGKTLSPETVRRMHAFFSRHAKNKAGGEDDAGYIAWMLWGGDEGRDWASRKVDALDRKERNAMSETRKAIMERLGMAATNDRPGAKAKMDRYVMTSEGSFHTYLGRDTRVPIEGGSGWIMVDPAQYVTPKRVRVKGVKGEVEVQAVVQGDRIVGVTAKALRASRPSAKAKFEVLNANYAKMEVRYMKPDGQTETEIVSGSARAAVSSAIRRIEKMGDGAKVWVKAFVPAHPLGRFPAFENVIWKGEVKGGRAYEHGGAFSRPGAKAKMARWEESHAEGWGDLSKTLTATINGTRWTIVVDASTGKGQLMRSTGRGPQVVKEGAVDQLKRYAETAKSSRPGAKVRAALADACWEGYEAVGTKPQDGKTVPNCVPKATAAKPAEDDLEREDVKAGLKLMAASDPAVSDKIRTLIKEGKPQDQAVAIALDMKRRGEL